MDSNDDTTRETELVLSNSVINGHVDLIKKDLLGKEELLKREATHKNCKEVRRWAKDKREECRYLIAEITNILSYQRRDSEVETERKRRAQLVSFLRAFEQITSQLKRMIYRTYKFQETNPLGKEQELVRDSLKSSLENHGVMKNAFSSAKRKNRKN